MICHSNTVFLSRFKEAVPVLPKARDVHAHFFLKDMTQKSHISLPLLLY